jgi:AraC family transcriptional regulator
MMKLQIVTRAPFDVIGLCYRGKNENQEIPHLWERFWSRCKTIPHVTDVDVCYGIADNFDRGTGEFDYITAVEVAQVADVPTGMEHWSIPAQTYAVFACTLPTLMRTFQFAYDEWLPVAGYARAVGPEFELYGPSFNPGDPRSPMQICIPIRPIKDEIELSAMG